MATDSRWRRLLGLAPAEVPAPDLGKIRFADVWKWQQQYELLANSTRWWLDFARNLNLSLLAAGAGLGALAAWFHHGLPSTVLAAAGAAVLTAAELIRARFATPAHVTRWTTARAIAESLNGALFQYRAGFKALDPGERESQFTQRVVDILAKDVALEGRQYRFQGKEKVAPRGVDIDIQTYVTDRAEDQRDWHIRRANQHRRHAGRLGWVEFFFTMVAAVVTAVGAIQDFKGILPWAGVATTIAAAFAAHLAAGGSLRIAASYSVTIGALKLIISRFDADTASLQEQSAFVTEVEAALTRQNDGWAEILTKA